MPKHPIPYQYKVNDTPLSVANQYGISPQELINANPGGYPFSTGQNLNVPQPITFKQALHTKIQGIGAAIANEFNSYDPSQYKTPLEAKYAGVYPERPAYLQARNTMGQSFAMEAYNNPVIGASGQPIGLHGAFGQSPYLSQPQPQYVPNNYNVDQRGRGYGPTSPAATNSIYGGAGVPPVGYGPQPNAYAPGTGVYDPLGVSYSQLPRPGFAALPQLPSETNPTAVSAGDYANTKAAQFYDANNVPLMRQLRFDPQTKKMVPIGKLIRQGKLDLQGNWHKTSRRQRIVNAQQNQKQQRQQDYTLANSLINFNASSG